MRILYISPVYENTNDPGSDRYYFCLKRLVEQGHDITVLTSSVSYKLAKIRPQFQGRLHTVVNTDGMKVVYLWSYPNYRGSFVRRLIYILSFLMMVVISSLFMPKPEVVYAVNSPAMVGLASLFVSFIKRSPLVYEVADLWPDAGIAMGVLKNSLVIRVTSLVEISCFKRASVIVALTRGIKNHIAMKGIAKDKIELVTNGMDPTLFEPIDPQKTKALRSELNLSGQFTCVYLGAHGHYNSLWTIIEAANCLKKKSQIAFVLIGDGDYKQHLENMVKELHLENVIFLPPIPRLESPTYLSIADAFLLPNRKGEFYKMNLPNKLFDFMASARPIVVAGEGETADVVQSANAGLVVPAEDSAAMAQAIEKLSLFSKKDRNDMGMQARDYVVNHYDRNRQVEQIERVLSNAISTPRIGV